MSPIVSRAEAERPRPLPRPEAPTWTLVGLYVFAATLVVSPMIDLWTTVWPPRVTELPWRYGFVGLGAGYLNTPLLGVVLASVVAYWQRHGRMIRVISVLCLAVAALLVPVIAFWPLDVMQMRALREEQMQAGVLVGGVIQLIKYFGAFVVLLCLGLGGNKVAKSL